MSHPPPTQIQDRIEWDEQALLNHFHPVGGLSEKSPTYKYPVAELLEMSQAERSRFLDFVSSCPRPQQNRTNSKQYEVNIDHK